MGQQVFFRFLMDILLFSLVERVPLTFFTFCAGPRFRGFTIHVTGKFRSVPWNDRTPALDQEKDFCLYPTHI